MINNESIYVIPLNENSLIDVCKDTACLSLSVGPLLVVGQDEMTAVLGPRQSNGLARAQR